MEKAKVALVTGASTGIGKATALELRRRGWRVFATVRRQVDVIDLTKAGRGVIEPLIMDVTDEASVVRAIEVVKERAGRLDALVNNAGIGVAGPLEMLPTERLVSQLDVNVVGVHRVTRAALPLLREAKGRIVMVSSVAGKSTYPFMGPYSASKHALEAYSDALRMELKGVVKVITIAPGSIVTPIWDKSTGEDVTPYANENYPAKDLERIARFFYKVGQRGLPVEKVSTSIADALELPWPLPRWMIVDNPLIYTLLEWLPKPITDWLKLRVVGWKARP